MMFFPQLESAGVTQFPLRVERSFRTVENRAEDGWAGRYSDVRAMTALWRCRFEDLSDSEANRLQSLFDTSRGQVGTFTFFDPLDNLLVWSEDFSNPAWLRDPLLSITGSISDPAGGSAAWRITNSSATTQTIKQAAGVPGAYGSVFSVSMRATVTTTVELLAGSGSVVLTPVAAKPAWTRVSAFQTVGGGGLQTEVGVRLPAGASIELYGAQLEVQRAPSRYKKTTSLSGVYPKARFAQDQLEWVREAPGRSRCDVAVTARMGGL